jgi:hypothetical protein
MVAILRGLIRRTIRVGKRVVFICGALVLVVKDMVVVDVEEISRHGRLFFGLALTLVGLLSFASDRYCDGNASSYYACTRPATYYYYPWWAILLIVIGSFLVVLWFLRRQHHA